LGVEQDEQAGEAILGLEGSVVQEPACGIPPALVIDQLGGPVPSGCGEVACGEPAGAGPAESLGRQGARGLAQVRRLESEVGLPFGDYLAADHQGVVARVLDDLPRNRRELGRSSSVLLRRRERAPVLTA